MHTANRGTSFGKLVIALGLAAGLVIGLAAPAAAENPYQGEGMRANGQDIEQSRPASLDSASGTSATANPDCWKGEGFQNNPNRSEDPCAAPQSVKAYYVCEAGEGLLDPARGPDPCHLTFE